VSAAPPKESANPARVFSIPPNVSFVDALAQGLLARAGGDPLALAAHMVLLPTRRACRALQEAFLRASGGQALLLPRLVPLGDIDAEDLSLEAEEAGAADGAFDVPPAMPAMRRQLLLARAIQTWGRTRGQAPGEDQAVRLAEELARLLDQVETEGLDLAALKDLVPAEYAHHWQQTLRFLVIVTEQWPKIQAEEACIGPAARRRRLLELRVEAWRAQPPDYPVIAAGSTGSMPATADLLNTIARLPSGAVVLPGLDRQAGAATWQAIAQDPAHPQFGMAALLARMGRAREDVADWPAPTAPGAPAIRAELVNLALAPAAATAEWRQASQHIAAPDLKAALAGVRRIDCPGPGEEAASIALLMREALETDGRRAALVTPDRGLARRVAAALGRWGIAVDDSAGTPLAGTAPGTFLRLVAEMICGGLAPLPLLAALKHPLASGGQAPGVFRAKVRMLETLVLRGPRPAPDFTGLKRALRAEKHGKALLPWLKDLETRLAPFTQAIKRARDLRTLIDCHIAAAEALAATAEDEGAVRLWAGEAGEALATVLAELREASGDGALALGGAARARYPALFTTLFGGQVVRPRYGRHPRLAIWGPLEARLQHTDLVILGGLNEGTWPSEVDPGPWLSRPMRADFGLPPPERRIGLAAHDFAQAFCAPEVVLTRATRIDGTPTVPSRWLLRLDAVLETFDPKPSLARDEAAWLGWAQALDQPKTAIPSAPPAPCPPRAARPRKLPVTAIETWMRDPYDLYARRILKLKALDPLDADPGAAELGILVHRALEIYIRDHPGGPPADAEAVLLACGRKAFEDEATPPGVRALWWPRFERIAAWLAARDSNGTGGKRFAEVKGELTLDLPSGGFTLTATADRIDLGSDGALRILDYKTGSVPSGKEVEFGFAPQLPLEAAIAAAGGFAGVPRAPVAALEYWRLTGAEPPGEIKPVRDDPQARAESALEGLRALIERFDDPATPYLARPRPKWMGRYSDYTHLARAPEWASGEDGDDGGGA
jgi:ATP-dependent helicase/nuclease subunit B